MYAKYQIIADHIRDKINKEEYKLNEVIPSELKLQKEYDVSRHTVRQAISVLVNEGYLRKKKGSGTYVDNRLDLKKKPQVVNKTIGVITTYVSDYIFPSIIRGIEEEFSEKGYSLLLASTNNNHQQEKECLEKMLQYGVQGIIVEPTKSNQYNPNLSLYTKIKEKNIPILMINAGYEELDFPVVAVDDVEGGFLATNLLLEHGHTNILLVTKIDDLQGKYRMKGFIQAYDYNKMSFTEKNILTYTTESKAESLIKLPTYILKNQITGVVCYNDEYANDLSILLAENKLKIPQDISLVGNDNSYLSTFGYTKLSTVDHPKEILGKKAANMMIEMIQKDPKQESFIYKPQIIQRNSVQRK